MKIIDSHKYKASPKLGLRQLQETDVTKEESLTRYTTWYTDKARAARAARVGPYEYLSKLKLYLEGKWIRCSITQHLS